MKYTNRLLTQIVFFFIQNPLLKNIFTGTIYRGGGKRICTPGLNCYSCPAAVTSCPMGAAQLFFAGAKHNISFFVAGFLLTIGMIFGRFICGYVCPMGLFQDIIYKIKTPKMRVKLKFARYIKYAVLVLFVVVFPMLFINDLSGVGSPWFCKYICPSGTIFAALPILASNEYLRDFAGNLFVWKVSLAMWLVVASISTYRFFCRVLCPLGAIYSLFNKNALFKMKCVESECVSCGRCAKSCHLFLNPAKRPNSPECIRCGACIRECGTGALCYNAIVDFGKNGGNSKDNGENEENGGNRKDVK
ncbi:MAG: 4Fe-4S binding protein [Oscillospiraceae bacterium]|nr:4Fe-4S binding protein [Oscillospiraceae bacterium]